MLELRHLRTLNQLRHTGSLTGAACILHLTQSALSHQLRQIEDWAGGQLFERKSKPLRFTPIGNRMLQLADDILPTVKQAENDILRTVNGEAGRLYIGVECHSCFAWLLPTLEHYRQHHPEIEQDLTMSYSFNAIDALREGLIDLAISSDPQPVDDIVWLPLFRYEILLGTEKQHALANKPFVLPEDLINDTLLTYPVDQQRLDIFRRFLWPAGAMPANTRHVELTAMMLQLVASGRGVCALPEWAYTEKMITLPTTCQLGENGLFSTLFAAVRAAEKKHDYIKKFIITAQQNVKI